MNKTIKHSFLVMLGALVLSGCSKDKEIAEAETPKPEVEKVDKDITAITTRIMENTTVIGTFVSDTTIKMAEGLHRTTIVFKRADKLPVSLFIIEADLKNPKLELQTISPYNDLIYGVQPISKMAADNEIAGTRIMAAINGSPFTAAGDPTGIYYVRGIGIKTTVPTTGNFIAAYKDKSLHIGGKDTKAVYRPIDYMQIQNAVSGTSWLVDNGVKATTTDSSIGARTAIGYTANQVVYAIVVDGSQATYSNGLGISNLIDIMASLDVVDAINMNGGSASSLTIRDATKPVWNSLNKPTLGKEASIGNGLAFVVKN